MSLKRINHGNENHTPGFVEDTGDSMTGDLNFEGGKIINSAAYIVYEGFTSMFLRKTGGSQLQIGGGPATDQCAINDNQLFFPVQSPTVSAPSYVEGGMYFDTTLHKLRIGGATDWETITSS